MKRLLCLVMLVLLMGISAVAEDNTDFIFVGNVRFGMTINEVEKALGIKAQQWDAEMAIAYKNNWGITNPKYLYLKDITIAGYDASAYFYFDESDTLAYVSYVFVTDNRLVAYNVLENMLTSKYGTTDYSSSTGRRYDIGFSMRPFDYYSNNLSVRVKSINKYSERLVPFNDTQDVLIEHLHYTNITTYMPIDQLTIRYGLVEKNTEHTPNWGL